MDDYIRVVGYIGNNPVVIIPEEWKGKPVKEIGDSAFFNCSVLTEITIPESVQTIGSDVFGNCSGLKSVTFENTDGWSAEGNFISSEELADKAKAALYLMLTYRDCIWIRQ